VGCVCGPVCVDEGEISLSEFLVCVNAYVCMCVHMCACVLICWYFVCVCVCFTSGLEAVCVTCAVCRCVFGLCVYR
jgi:hypothetical protein